MKREGEWDEVQAPPRFTPSKEWREAFHDQCNDTLVRLAIEYATERDAGIGSPASSPSDKRYTAALVLRVLTDTQLGVHRWDHHTPLDDHVLKILQSYARLAWKRAKKRPTRRWPHLAIEDATARGRSHALAELDRLVFEELNDRQRAHSALDELRERVADDPELSAFITAYCHEGSRTKVLRETGLSGEQYRQVRRRLRRAAQELSIEARPVRANHERKERKS
jgi:hypothetical protein